MCVCVCVCVHTYMYIIYEIMCMYVNVYMAPAALGHPASASTSDRRVGLKV